MKFNLKTLVEGGYNYLTCDRSGQIFAHKLLPIRGSGPTEGAWVLPIFFMEEIECIVDDVEISESEASLSVLLGV